MALSFENKDKIEIKISWDFIAEGVDQTVMVLYATCDATLVFDKVAYKKCSLKWTSSG
jgi:hypothetical protein